MAYLHYNIELFHLSDRNDLLYNKRLLFGRKAQLESVLVSEKNEILVISV